MCGFISRETIRRWLPGLVSVVLSFIMGVGGVLFTANKTLDTLVNHVAEVELKYDERFEKLEKEILKHEARAREDDERNLKQQMEWNRITQEQDRKIASLETHKEHIMAQLNEIKSDIKMLLQIMRGHK